MAEYKMVRLGDVCEQINGVSYKPADVYDSLTEKTTILLRANNIFEDKLNYDELVFVDKKRISENQYMKKGDILICASSGSKHLVGKAACLTEDKDLTFGAFCKVLRPKTVNPEYIKHYFFSPSYRTEISRLSEGANINNIKAADLDNLKIPLPSESIQNKIAKQLDKCVKIINNQKKALEKYDTLIKSRFIEMFGDPVLNPKKWNIEKLKTLTSKIGSGATPKGGRESYISEGISLVRSMNVYKGYFEYEGLAYITEDQARELDNVTLQENDVLINITGASVARCCILPKDVLPARVNQHVSILRATEKLNPVYLSNLLITDTEQRVLLGIGGAGGATREAITKTELETLDIPVPPIELQNDFATFVQQIDKSKFAVQKSLEKTETLYKSLMQRYFA